MYGCEKNMDFVLCFSVVCQLMTILRNNKMDKQKLLEQLEQLKEKKKQLDVIEQFQDTQQHAYKIFLD